MLPQLLQWISDLPPEVAVFILSMVPITELRASIPVGITLYGLNSWLVYGLAVIGDYLPAIAILYLLDPISRTLMQHSTYVRRALQWWFSRADRKFSHQYAKYGAIGLILFIGIPLPFTGSWTGAVAAWLFQIPKRQAMTYILGGVMLAGAIVTAITHGSLGIFRIAL